MNRSCASSCTQGSLELLNKPCEWYGAQGSRPIRRGGRTRLLYSSHHVIIHRLSLGFIRSGAAVENICRRGRCPGGGGVVVEMRTIMVRSSLW